MCYLIRRTFIYMYVLTHNIVHEFRRLVGVLGLLLQTTLRDADLKWASYICTVCVIHSVVMFCFVVCQSSDYQLGCTVAAVSNNVQWNIPKMIYKISGLSG